jgi:hypothetical protein
MGFVQPSMLIDPITINAIKNQLQPLNDLTIEGLFIVIVDMVCSVSASYCKDDFKTMNQLHCPAELVGVAEFLRSTMEELCNMTA